MPVLPLFTRQLQQGNSSPYYDQQQNQYDSFQTLLSGLQQNTDYTAQPLPQYNYAKQALNMQAQTQKLLEQSASNAAYNNTPIFRNHTVNLNAMLGGGGGKPKGRLAAVLRALGAQESGNRYGAVNSGSGALGRWQVMPSNIAGPGGWDEQVLGRNITTQQYLHNPGLQNQIVRGIFGGYLKRYGVKGALSAWYSGSPNRYNDKSSVHGGPSVYDYVQQVLDRM